MECRRFNPFIICSSDVAPGELKRVASNQYIKQCRNRQIGAFVNLFHLLAVRGQAKAALESADLHGLDLVPLVPDTVDWPVGIKPLHLVWSSLRLLPMDGELVRDGDFQVVPQLRYAGLDSSGIDIAITDECFGNSPHYHRIVYSKRAREVLESIDSELHYFPVITHSEGRLGGVAARSVGRWVGGREWERVYALCFRSYITDLSKYRSTETPPPPLGNPLSDQR